MFTFDESYTVTSRKQSVAVDPRKFSDVINANIYAYGLTQVIADAASGAVKNAAEGAGVFEGDSKAYTAWTKTPAYTTWAASEAGQKAIAESTIAMMTNKLEALEAGDWTLRGEASSVSRETSVGRRLMRDAMKRDATAAAWAKFTALSDEDQLAKIDANLAANADVMAADIAAEIKRLDEAKARKEALAKKVTITL